MNRIAVDFSKPYGRIKTFNAVNNGPVNGIRGINNMEAWRAAKIPYGRLHDTSFSNEWLVDVHRIFRDFDADENDPKNYIFAPTDKYIADMLAVGTEPYYRLGASIEHSHKYGTYPPKDYEKWARICEHIIRHYTEGWADGFNYNITYWEIWNEFDNNNATGNPCWQGTCEEFAEFFIVSCRYLQSRFPHLKIGGPAIATFHHTEWCEIFFGMLRDSGVRPDFISYHRYNKYIEDFVEYVRMSNAMMEKFGFGDIETHINEWNYVRGWRGEDFIHSVKAIKGVKGAAFTTGVMCALHPEKLDMLMYYEGRSCAFSGLWDQTYLTPIKGYYPFMAFSKMRELGTAVTSKCDSNLYALGATDGTNSAVLLTNFDEPDGSPDKEVKLTLSSVPKKGDTLRVKYHILDEEHNLECVKEERFTSADITLYLHVPIYSVYYIEIVSE